MALENLAGRSIAGYRLLERVGEYGSRVVHPGVVRTYDFGESDGLYYLALEWATGEPLADFLHREGPLAPADAIPLVRQLADALEETVAGDRPAGQVFESHESCARN